MWGYVWVCFVLFEAVSISANINLCALQAVERSCCWLVLSVVCLKYVKLWSRKEWQWFYFWNIEIAFISFLSLSYYLSSTQSMQQFDKMLTHSLNHKLCLFFLPNIVRFCSQNLFIVKLYWNFVISVLVLQYRAPAPAWWNKALLARSEDVLSDFLTKTRIMDGCGNDLNSVHVSPAWPEYSKRLIQLG